MKGQLNAHYGVFARDNNNMEMLNNAAYISVSYLDLLFSRLIIANGKAEDGSDSEND